MAIQYSNNCTNCEHLMEGNLCGKHQVLVSGRYTCNQFSMKAEFRNDRSCTNCDRFETSTCAHPTKAAPEMMCRSWTPQA